MRGRQALAQEASRDPGDEVQQGVAQWLARAAPRASRRWVAEQVTDGEQTDAEADDAQIDGVGQGDLGGLGGDREVDTGVGVDPHAGRAGADHVAAAVGALRQVLQQQVDEAATGLPRRDVREGGAESDGDGTGLEGAESGGVVLEGRGASGRYGGDAAAAAAGRWPARARRCRASGAAPRGRG